MRTIIDTLIQVFSVALYKMLSWSHSKDLYLHDWVPSCGSKHSHSIYPVVRIPNKNFSITKQGSPRCSGEVEGASRDPLYTFSIITEYLTWFIISLAFFTMIFPTVCCLKGPSSPSSSWNIKLSLSRRARPTPPLPCLPLLVAVYPVEILNVSLHPC